MSIVEQTLEGSIDRMEARLQELAAARGKPNGSQRHKDIRRLTRNISNFRAVTERVQNSNELTLGVLPYEPSDRETVRKLRKEFKSAKKGIFRELAQIWAQSFKKMGLTWDEISYMQSYGNVPVFGKLNQSESFALDISLEHDRPIAWGGTNDKDNLLAIPKYLNQLRSTYIHWQIYGRNTETVLTIEFRDKTSKVPYIPGGFREENDSLNYSRIAELLGCEII